jgi:hypothetical protein
MEAAAAPAVVGPTSRRRQRRLPLAQMLFAVAGVALLVICGAYALRFVSATAFHKERAFRVLDEIGGQLDNLQRTLANQLSLMPVELVGRECIQQVAGQPQLSNACSERRDVYQRRLALQGPMVGVASVSKELYTRACGQTNRYGSSLQPRDPGVPFTTFACAIHTQPGETGQLLTVAFQGSMAETLEGFLSQSFFDEVLVVLSDGTVVASVPRRPAAQSVAPAIAHATAIRLHPAKIAKLGIVNAAGLLGRTPDEQKSELPARPDLLTTKIADESYRVFIRVIQPRYGTYIESDSEKPAVRQERVFLIGLKRLDLRAELAGSLEPGGRFALTILTLLAFLVWPLASVRAKSSDDSIAWPEAAACLASVVLIPAVLAIAAVWAWSYRELLSWVDAGAARYSHSVAATLDRELQEGRRLLEQYQALYRQPQVVDQSADKAIERSTPSQIALRSRGDGGFVTGHVVGCSANNDRTCLVEAARESAGPWRSWATFSSVFATDARGAREGQRYTVYDPPLVKPDASYGKREYFRALQRGEGWLVTQPATGKAETFVAQRLFSGSDGSRVLQMAVPRAKGASCKDTFCGIVTGSATIHSLSAAVSPPLLRFAVIDRDSGIVIFHSDDSRSLAENIFVETERNPQLLALTQLGQSGFFNGRYLGAGHRFFHQPLPNTPWSVVVFYSLKEVGDLPWHAVFTALAAYAGALLVFLSISVLGAWLWAKRQRKNLLDIVANFWLRGRSSCSYAHWGLALFASALFLVTAYEIWAEGPVSLITRIMWGVLALAAAAVLLQHRLAIHSVCISLWLLLISAVPAAWMALGYHDVQVQGLLRDGLVGAARDIQHRESVIADDLRRWLSSGGGREDAFPTPWVLTRPSDVMPIPGYALGSCRGTNPSTPENLWTMCVFDEPPLATLITRRELDFWRRETWDASVQAETQQRRIRLLGHMNGGNPVCASQGTDEGCAFRTDEGQLFAVRAEAAVKDRSSTHKDDDRRFSGIAGALSSVGALLVTIFITWVLSVFVSRRLLGERRGHARAEASMQHGVLFYMRRIPSEQVDKILSGLRPGNTGTSAAVTRVNVATKALYTELAVERVLEGPVLLTNLDIALVDASRRRDILDALERLAENSRVQLLVLCRRSPIDQLYHPERYPESGEQHELPLEESLRWDNVLQKFECRDVENIDAPRTHPSLATVDHHRTWKLCTRSERLLLYDLARGRLANPRNKAVVDALLARGLVKLDPWPKIADASFQNFVRTAESAEQLAQWQRDAVQGSGRRVRSAIAGIALMVLLVGVVWFSWSAGDKFKVVSAIVAGAVAFLGQIGQAFNFVRTNSSAASGGRSGG